MKLLVQQLSNINENVLRWRSQNSYDIFLSAMQGKYLTAITPTRSLAGCMSYANHFCVFSGV